MHLQWQKKSDLFRRGAWNAWLMAVASRKTTKWFTRSPDSNWDKHADQNRDRTGGCTFAPIRRRRRGNGSARRGPADTRRGRQDGTESGNACAPGDSEDGSSEKSLGGRTIFRAWFARQVAKIGRAHV